MEKTNYLQKKTWSIKKVGAFWNNLSTFLKAIIVINVSLLLTLLVINLVNLVVPFIPQQQLDENQPTKDTLFDIPKWLTFIITFFGSTFNLVSITLMYYKKKSTFIWGLLGVICLGLIHLQNKLWGLVIIYWGYYVITQIIMFFWWGKKINSDRKIITSHAKLDEFILICLLLTSIAINFMLVRQNVPKVQEWLPTKDPSPIVLFLDSFIMSFALSTVYFVAKRYIERWIISLIVDSAQVVLYVILIVSNIQEGKYLSMTSNIVFLLTAMTLFALALYGWINWNRDHK